MASQTPRSAHMHGGPGFRVKMNFRRPDTALMQAFRAFPTPDISDQLNRLYAVAPAIRLQTHPQHTVCGPALTVKVFPGDNLMVHKALDLLEPGDIIIVDAGGSSMNAVLGDLISTKARHRGCQGFVIDGYIRDLPDILALEDFPVFAKGTTPIGPLHRGPGEINYPICLGGVVVNPGDIIVGDAAGVVVIPQSLAPELLKRLQEHSASQASYLASVQRGDFSNAWVDKVLTDLGCPVERGESPADSMPAEEPVTVA